MVVAASRAQAEDAAELIAVEYEALPPVVDVLAALEPGSPVIHPGLGDNLAFERRIEAGDVDAALAAADHVVEACFTFGRHTGVTLEARAIVADWNEGEARLTVHQGTQAPHMMQSIYARHLGLEEQQVRVVCDDVGGSFGIKIHVYGDEMATAAASRMLRRAGAVRGRPAGKLRFRHSRPRPCGAGADRGDGGGGRHRVRRRRHHRHRAVLGLSADVGGGGEPGDQPDRRAVYRAELPGADTGGVPEQGDDVAVPRGRAPDRDGGDGGSAGHGGAADRDGPGGDKAAQSDPGRRLSVPVADGDAVRGAVPPCGAGPADGVDGLRGASGRSRRKRGAGGCIAGLGWRASSS